MSSASDTVKEKSEIELNMNILKSSQNEIRLLWEEGDLLDITLEVNGEFIQAHRVVLVSHSPYFKAMLCGRFQDAHKKSIELKGGCYYFFKKLPSDF